MKWTSWFSHKIDRSAESKWMEAERGLLLASGAVWLALVGLLAATWDAIGSARTGLRLAILTGLAEFGFSFVCAAAAMAYRLTGVKTRIAFLIWLAAVGLGAGMFYHAGSDFISALSASTGREQEAAGVTLDQMQQKLDQISRTSDEQDNILRQLDERLKDLDARLKEQEAQQPAP